ncbi:MAG: cytochrome c, partial [bacterium]
MNISMDNGQPDWKQSWDQQIQLRKTLYGTHCSICHGGVGRGDGPEGKHLVPPPINYNNLDWAAGARSGYPVTNSYLFDIIANGKIKPGSQTVWTGMPWWKDQLRETDMWGLVDYVRSLTYESD